MHTLTDGQLITVFTALPSAGILIGYVIGIYAALTDKENSND